MIVSFLGSHSGADVFSFRLNSAATCVRLGKGSEGVGHSRGGGAQGAGGALGAGGGDGGEGWRSGVFDGEEGLKSGERCELSGLSSMIISQFSFFTTIEGTVGAGRSALITASSILLSMVGAAGDGA